MTSKLVVNTIEADTGISSVSFASSISMNSTAKFHFSAAGVDIGADTNINRPAAGVLGFNISGAEKVRIDSDGQIGIGNITPDTWSTGNGLTIGTSQATLWGVGDQVNLSGNAYFNSGWKAAATKAGASQIQQALGVIDFRVSGSVTADAAITFIDALRITKTGNVEIDSFNSPSTRTLSLRTGYLANANGGVGLAAKDHSGSAADGLGLYGTDGVSIHTANAGTVYERLRINTSGNVNIGGNYTETSHPLNVSDATKPSLALHTGTALRADFSATTGITSIRSYSNSPFTINIGGSGETEAFRIDGNGKVIVGNNGTTFGNAAVQAFIQHGNTAGESGFSSVDTTSVAAGVGGEIAFHGKYNTGAQDYAYYGHIRGIKENATNGNTACALTFHTRPNATAPIERLRIDSSGRLIVGGGTHAGGSALVVKGGNQNNYSTIGMFSNHTNPANNTLLTQIRFGANASAVGADIRVYADADWGTNDYPTRMEFHTTPDGSNSKQVRLKIEKDGRVNVLGPKLKLPTGTSNPGSSVAGDSYYNTSDGTFKIYDGSIWGSVVVAAKGTQQNPAANSTELAATGALAQYYFKPNTGDTAFQQYACGGLSNLGTIPSGGPSWVNSHSSLIIIEKGQVGATSTMKMSQANYGKFIKESITRNSGTTPYVYWAVFDGGTLWGIWRIRWTGATYSTWFSNHNYSEGVNTAPSGTPSSDVWKTGSGTTGNALATGTYTISNNTSLNRAVLPEQDYNSAGSWGIHYKRLGSGEHYPWRNSAGNYTSNGYFEPSTSYSMGTDTRYIHYVYLADN